LGTGFGKGLIERDFGFGEARLLAFALFGAAVFDAADFVLGADLALDDFGLALA
jgi:hypothetical protein